MDPELVSVCKLIEEGSSEQTISYALDYLLKISATDDGLQYVDANRCLVDSIAHLAMKQSIRPSLLDKCFQLLLNISAHLPTAGHLLTNEKLLERLVDLACDVNSVVCSSSCGVLSNITRGEEHSRMFWNVVKDNADRLIDAVTERVDPKQDHLAYLWANLTQLQVVRDWMLTRREGRIAKLLPQISDQSVSLSRRIGIVGAIRNCCFDPEHHEYLLSADLNLVSRLAFPLLGSDEGLDEDEIEKLPIDLQYLGTDKEIERSPELRVMLIEALNQLCADKVGRSHMRDSGVYYVLRELHKIEKDKKVMFALENLVDVLISDDPIDEEHQNFKKLEIPEHLVEKFEKLDAELLGDNNDDYDKTIISGAKAIQDK